MFSGLYLRTMKCKTAVISFLLTLILSACYRAPKVPDFNKEEWINLKGSCDTPRVSMAEQIRESFDLLKGASQNEVRVLLGKPDRHQLYLRNQKFFFYDLQCPEYGAPKKQLRIRFDALGEVREILVELKVD